MLSKQVLISSTVKSERVETRMEPLQQRPKIIIASPSLNLLGGAQRACLHAVYALRKANYKVILATIDKTNWVQVEMIFGDAPRPDGEMYLFRTMPRMPTEALRQAFIAIFYAAQLLRVTMKNKSSLVINMGGEIADNLGNVVYINAVPLRLMHLFPPTYVKSRIEWKMYGRIYSVFLRTLGNSAATIVANSKFTQSIIQKHLGKRALVLHPPISTNKIATRVKTKKRKNLVVTIARFRSAKGLNIIPKIAGHVKNCEFALIGIVDDGSEHCLRELYAEVKRHKLQEHVHVFSNMPYDFALETLSNAKVFLQTQSTEAFGMSIVESMAAGCVPLVPRMGGPWIDILDSQEGLYGLSYENISEAAEKIQLMIDNENLRSEVSARAIKRAEVFDNSVFERKLCNIIKATSMHDISMTCKAIV